MRTAWHASGSRWSGRFLALGLLLALPRTSSGEEPSGARVPVALEWVDADTVAVAQRDGRSLALVDLAPPSAVRELARLPFRPAALALRPEGGYVVGGTEGELAFLEASGQLGRCVRIGRGPLEVETLPDGRVAAACRWDRRVTILAAPGGEIVARHDLPFSPGSLAANPDGRLAVADAFGGHLAVLDPGPPARVSVRTIDGANLHALDFASDGREILVAHLIQPSVSPATRTNLDWGVVISSRLSALRISEFEGAPEPEPAGYRRLVLDRSRHGAADPTALASTPDGGILLIALGGANQVLHIDRSKGTRISPDLLPLGDSQRLEVVDVGRNPRDVAIDPTGRRAATADAMSDTITVLDVATHRVTEVVRLGDSSTLPSALQRGEAAFHDASLAFDRWMSCASCHTLGHTNGLNYDTLGDGHYGAAKNTPSLLGLAGTAPFGWTGRFADLRSQAEHSLTSSLHGPGLDPAAASDLVAYLESLPPPPPRRVGVEVSASVGRQLFETLRCASCHRPPTFTVAGLRDVGRADAVGTRQFNPPRLEGAAWSAPYFHDGSAPTLETVLHQHHPGIQQPPTAMERQALVAFLESLGASQRPAGHEGEE